MTIAKGIGGGFPLGALLATEDAARGMGLGTRWQHLWRQSAGLRRRCRGDGYRDRAGFSGAGEPHGGRFRQGLEGWSRTIRRFRQGARRGLMLALECRVVERQVVNRRHVLVVAGGDNVVRLLLSRAEVDEGCTGSGPQQWRWTRGSRGMSISSISTTPAEELRAILGSAAAMKAARAGGARGVPDADQPLKGRIVALIFSPRPGQVGSFDVGVRQLGSETLVLSGTEMQLGHGETIADTAQVLSRFVDLIMIRTFEETTLLEMAEHATVPVINGLTDTSHPCQIMADILTYEEHRGPIAGAKVVWSGGGNNVCASFPACGGAVRL